MAVDPDQYDNLINQASYVRIRDLIREQLKAIRACDATSAVRSCHRVWPQGRANRSLTPADRRLRTCFVAVVVRRAQGPSRAWSMDRSLRRLHSGNPGRLNSEASKVLVPQPFPADGWGHMRGQELSRCTLLA